MYQETKVIASDKGYSVNELVNPVGGRNYTLWGPDANGRYCRMAAYFSKHDAMVAFYALIKKV